MMRFAIICTPENRRYSYFERAVTFHGFLPPICISYLDVLQNKADLTQVLSSVDVLKIESIGENFNAQKELIALAENQHSSFISKSKAKQLSFDKGIIRFNRQEYCGFQLLLQKIQEALTLFPHIQVMNSINDISLMLDKTRFHQKMIQKKISVIPAIYNIKNFTELIQKMMEHNWTRVFIKPNHGSSAAGVIAFRKNSTKMMATTSIEYTAKKGEIKLYNSLKIRRYQDPEQIEQIVNTIAQDGIIVEKWLPKPSIEGSVYDFRVVTINQKANHIIARQSTSPMTNLHLGNRRGNLDRIKTEIGAKAWNHLQELAKKTAAALPNSLYAGLDILLTKGTYKPYLIEANAFGDLLPNLLINGHDTYQAQIQYYKTQ